MNGALKRHLVLALVAASVLGGRAPVAQAADAGRTLRPERRTHADAEITRLAAVLEEEIADPSALLHVATLGQLIDEATELQGLTRVLSGIATHRDAHPEVRALARMLVARNEWRRGRLPHARRWMNGLGVVTDVMLVGPFDNEGGSGFAIPWKPESDETARRAPDIEERFEGKEGFVSWRALPDVFPLGYVDLSAIVDPSHEVVVYLRAVVESRREQDAAIRMGTPGPTKVWLNGREVFSSAADHPPRFDQHAVGLRLPEGRSSILLKLSQRQGALGFYLRLTDSAGGPLTGVTFLSPDTQVPRRAGRGAHPEADTVLQTVSAAAAERPSEPAALALEARVLALRHPYDRSDRRALEVARDALRACERASGGACSSGEEARLRHLVAAHEDDGNRRRMQLEAALALDEELVGARLDLALYEIGRGFERAALPHLRRVVAAAPGHARAALALADTEARVGFSEAELRRVARLGAEIPRAPALIARAAFIEMERGRPEGAAERLRMGLGLYPGDRSMRAALISTALDLGRLNEAMELLEDAIVFEPSSVSDRLMLADLASTNGEPERAEGLFDEAAALAPERAGTHYRRTLHELRYGRVVSALQHLEEAFARRPQEPRIADLRDLLSEDVSDFAAPYLEDARELAARRGEWGSDEDDVVTLAETTVVQVHRSGLSTRVNQEIFHVKTPRGVERMRARSVGYTPGDQLLRIQQARVIRPDGSVLPARSEHERSLSQPWARLYFDQRARVVSFPELAPGDVVEIVWRREDVSGANMFGDYFGDLTFFQSTSPIARRSYVLVAPAERELFFNELDLPGVEHSIELHEDGSRVFSWTATDIERVVPEGGMPGWAEVAAFLHVSTYETWRDVADWWWRLIDDQLRPSPELRQTALRLVEGIPREDVAGRVAAIHNYVVRRTRYVGLEFGIHGYKPYRVDQIHERRFGDCKDTAALMHALLGAIGIDSHMVILRMRRLGRISDYPASLAPFNHAILYVPELEMWLDGTAGFSGTGELPTEDQDAAVIVVNRDDPSASRFGYVPVPPAERNVSSTDLRVALAEDGAAEVRGAFVVRGSGAPGYRRAYQAPENRRRIFEQGWARAFPGVRVNELDMGGLDDLEMDVTAQFDLSLPNFARARSKGLAFRPLGEERGYGERYASLATRRHDLVLAHPFITRHRVEVTIPKGWRVARLPSDEALESSHGSFSATYAMEGDEVTVELEVALRSQRIEASDYSAFRDFLSRVDRALTREVRLVRESREEAR